MSNHLTQGFVLTRASHDDQGRVLIEYWLSSDDGPVKLIVDSQRPVFFISKPDLAKARRICRPHQQHVELVTLQLKTFNNEFAVAIYTNTLHHAYLIQSALRRSDIEVLETDLRPHDRYLMERFAYGSVSFRGTAKRRPEYTHISNAQLKKGGYQPQLSIVSLDIECAMDGELFSIGLAGDAGCQNAREVLMIGPPQAAETSISWQADERELLLALCQRITELDPDLIIGWNLINFDFRILMERAKRHGLALKLGRDNSEASWRPSRNDAQKGYATIPGRVAIDGIDSLKSATWSFTSFSLENVSQELLGRGKKVDGDVDDRIAEIVHNFHHNKPALAAYNLEDCELVLDIFEHTKIIDYLVLRSRMTGLEMDRAGGSVAAFTNLYLPKLHRGGYVAPNLPEGGGLSSPGGYVMDSKPGLYRNVLVLDFKSLYPSIIRTFKVDPMGLIEGLKTPAESLPGFRNAMFHRDKHFLPEIITSLWKQRDQAKQDNNAVLSQAIKIIMNSFYGVLGSGGCRFYDTRLASSITLRGHEIMQTTSQWIETQGYNVIYGDTDSTFVSLDDDLTAEQCTEIGKQLQNLINQRWTETLKREFDIENKLEIEFETQFKHFLMPTIRGSDVGSKKRYAGLIVDPHTRNEKLVFKGLENVRTDWTQLARQFQASLFDLVFHQQDPSTLITSTVEQTLSGKRDDDLIYRKQLRRKLGHYVKNVPPQVRAARIADEKNRDLGKSLKYQNKGWISYLITVNGPEPVEYRLSNIDYDHYIEKQIKPIADGVLPFIGLDFDALISNQGELF